MSGVMRPLQITSCLSFFYVLGEIHFLGEQACLEVAWDNWDKDVHSSFLVL